MYENVIDEVLHIICGNDIDNYTSCGLVCVCVCVYVYVYVCVSLTLPLSPSFPLPPCDRTLYFRYSQKQLPLISESRKSISGLPINDLNKQDTIPNTLYSNQV